MKAYENTRNSILEAEDLLALGGRIKLSKKEETVNEMLMEAKFMELSQERSNDKRNIAGMHFFKTKDLIDKSSVFKFVKKMPKGGTLHAHNSAQVSSAWVIRNVTYDPKLYMCKNKEGVVVFTFRKHSSHRCITPYRQVVEQRKKALNARIFDKRLETNINLYTPKPEGMFAINNVEFFKTNFNVNFSQLSYRWKSLDKISEYVHNYF